MRDRQVEVVGGNHVVVRVAGVVVVVGHRENGPVRDDSAAMEVAEALSQVVFEAAERAPAGPGRIIAREATNWLTSRADSGAPTDLGIVSGAESGAVAIFLHGAVTAMLVHDDGVEYLRGADAVFSVDHVAEPPARAVAVVVDTGRDPELPERGIGSLVEGVASAAGAIVWFEGRRSRARDRDEAPAEAGSTAQPTGTEPQGQAYASSTTGPQPVSPAAANPRLDRTQLARPSDPSVPLPVTAPADAASVPPPMAAGDDPSASGRAPDPASGRVPVPDIYGGATELVGSGPPPLPDWLADDLVQDAQNPPRDADDPPHSRRDEATERAPSLSTRVLGFVCARAHPSDPRAAFCTVCGMPVDQTQRPTEVVRPPLGRLMLDDGTTLVLIADTVLGRDPQNSDAAQRGMQPFKIEDTSGGMSRAHAEIRLVNWDVTIADRGSTNGTHVRLPGRQDWIRVLPNQPMALPFGAELMLGGRVLRLDPTAPTPFG
ncbi:FHA domain-containing protein [Nocardia alni]|uniref:FHA domain-containing protein n=1 Tax=Nocardia alni TaxID=2815723 RepID=UPI001C23BAA6|nr:FHA domain-containing protein [Nocardia alni]